MTGRLGLVPVAVTAAGPAVLSLATAAGKTTSEEPVVSPGMAGFLVTLAVVLACIPLFRSMVRKIRGVQYRAEAAEDVPTGDGPEPDAREPGAPGAGAAGAGAAGSGAAGSGTQGSGTQGSGTQGSGTQGPGTQGS